jgi:hypothetical protein
LYWEKFDKKFILMPHKATTFAPQTFEVPEELPKKNLSTKHSQLSSGKCRSPHSEANNLECWAARILVRSKGWRFSDMIIVPTSASQIAALIRWARNG